MSDIRHGLYLITGRDEEGRLVAICSDGTPQLGHEPVTLLTLEIVRDLTHAAEWFERVKQERPWETRQ